MQILIWFFNVLLVCSTLGVFPFPPFSLAEPISQAPPVCSLADRAALLGFKAKIVKDTTESFSSWIGRDCCGGDWEGVQCNPAGRVITLALQRPARDSSLYMKGTLSSSLGSLPFLEVLVIRATSTAMKNKSHQYSFVTFFPAILFLLLGKLFV